MAPSDSIRNNVALVGVGHTEYARTMNRTGLDLIAEATQKALDDCGLRKEDIDGLATNYGPPLSVDLDIVREVLGLNVRWYGQTRNGGSNNDTAIQWAAFAVHHGLANYVAIVFGDEGGPMRFGGETTGRETGTDQYAGNPPYGMTSPGAAAAMGARIYFHRYGATAEQLAAVPVAFRKHASLNPAAMMRDPLTLEDYLSARYVCEPLRRLDYCLVGGGGTCVIVTTAERARELKKPPVYIMGFQGIPGGRQEVLFVRPGLGVRQQDVFDYTPKQEELPAFQMAGVKREDIDALYTYDAFSIAVWGALERFGFCGPGEAAAFTQGGRIELGGELPMNTSGGFLSEAHVEGWANHIEIVRQLRGECGERQVKDIQVAMYASIFGDAIIYGR